MAPEIRTPWKKWREIIGIIWYSWKEPLKEIPFCEECVMSKQHRGKFPKGQRVSKERLKYIHSDLWGPATHETVGRKIYNDYGG